MNASKFFPLEVWPQHIFAYPTLQQSNPTQLPSLPAPEPVPCTLLSVGSACREPGTRTVCSPPALLSRWVPLFPTSWHKVFLQLWVRQHSLSSSAITPSSRGGKQDPQSVIPEMGECGNQPLSC